MTTPRLGLLALAAVVPCCALAQTQLRIDLPGHDQIVRNRVRYTCDASAPKLNLPSGPFTVEYIRVGDNGFAIVPVGTPRSGTRLIFANVISASGERFAAREYEWGDKGSDAWLTSARVGPDGKQPTTFCHELK